MSTANPTKNYMSIGAFSKITRASIKSLRYYESLGIFKPSYTNPESGFRYYDPSQIYMVNLIKMCIDGGMQISELQDYFSEANVLEIQRLFNRLSDLSKARAREAYASMVRMDAYSKEYARQIVVDVLKDSPYQMPEITLLVARTGVKRASMSYQRYKTVLSSMLLHAQELDFISLAQQGLVLNDGGTTDVFIQIHAEEGQEEALAESTYASTYYLVNTEQKNAIVRSVQGSDVGQTFSSTLQMSVPGHPLLLIESWAYTLVTGIYANGIVFEP